MLGATIGPAMTFGYLAALDLAEAGKIDAIEVKADPRAEWRQIFLDAYRFERDYFYDPNMHGVDWNALTTVNAALQRVPPRDLVAGGRVEQRLPVHDPAGDRRASRRSPARSGS